MLRIFLQLEGFLINECRMKLPHLVLEYGKHGICSILTYYIQNLSSKGIAIFVDLLNKSLNLNHTRLTRDRQLFLFQ